LRKASSQLIYQLNTVKEEYNRYREEVENAKTSDGSGNSSQPTRQVAPSLDHTQQTQSAGDRQIMTSGGGGKKLF